MRYLRVNQFVIDSQLPLMWNDGNEISLEPKQHALLMLFIEQANQVISRDEIIETVNQGVIVSDNAVNKMVANLRQLLADNPKAPTFIKTIPKQGYCFIAPIAPQEDKVTAGHKDEAAPKSSNVKPVFILSLLLAVASIAWQGFSNKSAEKTYTNLQLQPLTRHSGVEFSPAVSPNGNYLAYTRNDPRNGVGELWLRHLDGSEKEVKVADLATSAEIAWSSNSDFIVFTDYPEQQCQFKRYDLAGTVSTLSPCNALYIRQMALIDNNEGILYAGREVSFAPNQIYRYSMANKTREVITQPNAKSSGNYGFDLSDDGQQLLILSANEDSEYSNLYVLDRKNNQLTNKGKWPRFVYRAIWHHDGESIVTATNAYSHEIVQTKIDGTPIMSLVSTSNRVAHNFSRFPNGRDYYFTSFQMNNDNELINLATGEVSRRFNSAVYDKLPTFSPSTKRWYFLSKRNGHSQIFEADEVTGQIKQLTHFEQEPDVDTIDVSPDGKTLLLGSTAQLTLLSLSDNSSKIIDIDDGSSISAAWLSNTRIALGVLRDTTPLLRYYDLTTNAFSDGNPRWQAAFSDTKAQRLFFVEQDTYQVYQWFADEERAEPTSVTLDRVFSGGIDVKVDGDSLIYLKRQGVYSEFIRVSLSTKQQESLGKWLFVAGFDVLDNHLVVSYEEGRSGDILKTEFK